MKYFTELLESYSKLKKRKLKLLSEANDGQVDAQAEGKARALVQSAKNSNGQEIPIEGSNSVVWLDQEGKVVTDLFGRAAIQVDEGTEGYQKLVSYFSKKDGEPADKKQEDTGEQQPTDTGVEEEVAALTSAQKAQILLQEQGKSLEEILEIQAQITEIESLLATAKLNSEFSISARIGLEGYLTRLTNAQFGIERNIGVAAGKKGEWETVGSLKDAKTMIQVNKNVISLLNLLNNQNANSRQIEEVFNKFQVTTSKTDPKIVVKAGGREALVFKDSNLLKYLLAAASKRFGKKFVTYVPPTLNTGFDNNFRGTFLEYVRTHRCLLRSNGIKDPKRRRKILNYLAGAFNQIAGSIRNVASKREEWVSLHAQTAIQQSTFDTLEEINIVLKKDYIRQFIDASIDIADRAIGERKVAWIISKGTTTRHGKRDDTEEVYTTEEDAINGLIMKGISREKITAKKIFLPNVASEMDLKLMKLSSNFTPEQLSGQEPVYTAVETLKNYIKIGSEVVAGTSSPSSNGFFITQPEQDYANIALGVSSVMLKDPKEAEDAKAFRAKFDALVNQSPEDSGAVKQFHQDCWGLWDELSNYTAPKQFVVKDKRGRLSPVKDVFSDLARKFVELTRRNSDYTDVNDEETVAGKLLLRCKAYLNKDDNDQNARKRITAYATMMGTNKKIAQGLNSKNEKERRTSRQYLATMLFNTGASIDDSLYADYYSLETQERFRFFHNEPMLDAIKSIYDGDGKWEVKFVGNGFHIVKPGTNQHIALTQTTAEKAARGADKNFTIRTSCTFSRGLLEAYNKHIPQPKRESTILDAFIQSQRTLLETLIKLQEKSILQGQKI